MDQSIDLVLAVSEISTLDEMSELSRPESTSGVAELEWPEEVADLLEVGADGEDLVDHIFHTDDTKLAKALLDDGVVGKREALLVDLAIATLVDQFTNSLEVGVAIGDIWFDDLQHLGGGLGKADEDTIVDLEET